MQLNGGRGKRSWEASVVGKGARGVMWPLHWGLRGCLGTGSTQVGGKEEKKQSSYS